MHLGQKVEVRDNRSKYHGWRGVIVEIGKSKILVEFNKGPAVEYEWLYPWEVR